MTTFVPAPKPCSSFAALFAMAGLAILATANLAFAANDAANSATPALKPTATDHAKVAAKKTAKASPPGDPKPQGKSSSGEQSIVALVNDDPITGYEVAQRSMMLAGSSIGPKAQELFKHMIQAPGTTEKLKAILQDVIQANPGKNKEQLLAIFEQRKKDFALNIQRQAIESAKATALPGVRKKALDELIDERLKIQEAKKLNAVVPDEEIERVLDGIAAQNKMTKQQLAAQFGGTLDPMKTRIRSTLSFNEVVKRKFGHQIATSGRDIDRFQIAVPGNTQDQVELQVQRIVIAMPAALDQAGVAQRMQEAEQLRTKFTDCKSAPALAKGVNGARFEDLGKRAPSQFNEPARTLLLNAKDGEMLPPNVGEDGISLYAVCGHTGGNPDSTKRAQSDGESKQKDFELLSKRYLKDLRTDAHIEYR